MVHPLVGVVSGFLKAADVSLATFSHIHPLTSDSQEASNNFVWMRSLADTAAEYIARAASITPRDMDIDWNKAIETFDM